jgi:hypothetical protein
MTEGEWLTCTDTRELLDFLDDKASERKAQLFSVACCRLIWDLIIDPVSRQAVEVLESYADGEVTVEKLEVARKACRQETNDCIRETLWRILHSDGPDWEEGAWKIRLAATRDTTDPVAWKAAHDAVDADQAALLHDIFGNPFRSVVANPTWLTWHDGTVRKIAQAIYDERPFDRMPILADALEEAGCDNADILNHCRENGSHVRGCWVIDLLLGKQ